MELTPTWMEDPFRPWRLVKIIVKLMERSMAYSLCFLERIPPTSMEACLLPRMKKIGFSPTDGKLSPSELFARPWT